MHLTRALNRKDVAFKKDYRTYTALAKPLEKKAGIETVSRHNESFALFVASLPEQPPHHFPKAKRNRI